jgi:hypothetical protein
MARKGRNAIVPILPPGFPRKSIFEKHCNLYKKHGVVYTTHNTCDCCGFEKDGKERSNFITTKKGGKKGNPVNQYFV